MEELDLKEIFLIFWEKRKQILFIVLMFIAIGIGYSYFFLKPIYKSSTTLILTQTSGVDSDGITQADVTLNSKLVSTYEEIIKRKNILIEVVNNINNPEITIGTIKNNVTVQSVKSTELIEITVKNDNPNYAATIANEIAKVFCERVVEIYNISNTYILDRAEPETQPCNINHKKDIVIFAFIGLVVAAIYVLILNMLDNTIKTEEDVEKVSGLIVLTTIPDYTLGKGGKRK